MPTFKRKKMCAECPFRLGAARGYLGPLTVEDLLKTVHGPEKIGTGYVGDVGELICHMDIATLKDSGSTDREIHKQGQMCVGMVRYTNSVFKRARDEEFGKFQDELRKVPDDPVIPAGKLECYHTLEKKPCRVTFRSVGPVRGERFDVRLNGEPVGQIRPMPLGEPGYYFSLRVSGSSTNTTCDDVAACKEGARKFCQDNINWNAKEAT